jgi:trk system potassium uptake protein TrkA
VNVIIVGAGQVGSYLASLLAARGERVTFVEPRAELVNNPRTAPAGGTVVGSGTDPEALERAGIHAAAALAAVTGSDATNLATALLARLEYGVPRVAARVNDPHCAWLFTPALGVDSAINQADLLAHLLAEAVPDTDHLSYR